MRAQPINPILHFTKTEAEFLISLYVEHPFLRPHLLPLMQHNESTLQAVLDFNEANRQDELLREQAARHRGEQIRAKAELERKKLEGRKLKEMLAYADEG